MEEERQDKGLGYAPSRPRAASQAPNAVAVPPVIQAQPLRAWTLAVARAPDVVFGVSSLTRSSL